MIFDAHLDMAMNALDYEREQTWEVAHLREREQAGVHDDRGTSTVSIPELRAGGTAVVLTTVIARCKPWVDACRANIHDCDSPAPSMSHSIGMGQLAYYKLLAGMGEVAILTTASALREHADQWAADPLSTPLGLVLTMEGADPITTPSELRQWHALGLRTLMLAHFGPSRYAHGTPSSDSNHPHDIDGPLSDMGRALLPIMEELSMPLDLTHTSDKTFAEAADRFGGRIYSSHTACRSVCEMPRNHTDAQLKQIIDRDGVIGLPMFNHFLKTGYKEDSRKDFVTYSDVVDHIDHICQLAGSSKHVALGSDSDGGFGSEHMPAEIDTHRDLNKLTETLSNRGYSAADCEGIMQGNWMRFFGETLP